jgi:hypothetical protein
MSARKTAIHLVTKAAITFAALFLVSVLLAAMPGHHAPTASFVVGSKSSVVGSESGASAPASDAQEQDPSSPNSAMRETKMSGDEKSVEGQAIEAMTGEHHDAHSLHMDMTSIRPQIPGDEQRAREIVTQLRASLERYKDYHVALDEGFKIFHPEIPQAEYHFTSYKNGFMEAFTFDPARPTSLLYKKTAAGYELVGAMYTMPKRATEDELNARVPLSIAMWHLHTNLCMPPKSEAATVDRTKFGLRGSIATQDACDAAGGRFHPVIFGWMVHVYPYEDSLDKIFAMHMD